MGIPEAECNFHRAVQVKQAGNAATRQVGTNPLILSGISRNEIDCRSLTNGRRPRELGPVRFSLAASLAWPGESTCEGVGNVLAT